MSNPYPTCDECKRPLKAPSPVWFAPTDAVVLCKECVRTSGPAPASGMMPCVLEVEADAAENAAAAQ